MAVETIGGVSSRCRAFACLYRYCVMRREALHLLGSITPPGKWCNTRLSGVTPLRNKCICGECCQLADADRRLHLKNLQVRVRADVIHIPSEQLASIHRFVLRS